MSRDAYDDERYDDGGGDRRRDDGYDDGEQRPSVIQRAKNKVGLIGILQAIFGIIALLVALSTLFSVAFAAEQGARWAYDFQVEQMAKNPQPGQKMPPFEEYLKQYIMQNVISGIVWTLTSIPMILGGFSMRSLKSYSLSMIGAIAALIPCCNGCICCAMPFGIWSLIVLLNADVKEGFRLTAQRATGF